MEYEDYIEEGDYEGLEKIRERRRKLYTTALNSTVLYLLSYLIVYLIYYIITLNVAENFGIKAKLFYWKIEWLTGNDSPNWYQRSIKNIFSLGPYMSFALALFVAGIYIVRRNSKGLFPLFCIWLFMHFMNMFLGSVIVGLLTTINYPYTSQILKTISDFMFFTKDATYCSDGFGYVSDWLYFTNQRKIILFIGSFIISMLIGFFSAKFFLKSSQSVSLIKTRQSRQVLIMFQTFIPWLFGSLFLLLIKFPHDTRYEIYFYLTMLVMISPSLLNVLRDPDSFRKLVILKQPKPLEIHKAYLFTTLICYLIFRVVFSFGIFVTF
jgi:hypothetical protein